ncbi:MAG: acyl-CoA/acyl-ACP dehydrogenase [Deltaproteobacteria bacterium]|nr:MAG: acyl-CoA/acyl-ACP dehydrogenase [Deltaproteobacteria bacterium]
MDFDLTEEQEQLRASVRAVLERESPRARAREVVETGAPAKQPWQSAVDLGWTAINVPERFGGLGLGAIEVALVVEEHGRALAPGPYLATVSQFAPALRAAGSEAQQERFLGAVASGDIAGTLAVAGPAGLRQPPDASLRARPDGEAWILDGVRNFVVDGDCADEIAVAASVDCGDGVGLFVAPRDAARSERLASLDATRSLATLHFEAARIEPDRVLGEPGRGAEALRRTLEEATVALATEITGTCQTLFDATLDYAKHREQFGRPIGSFQAIQHRFADMFIAIEKARATCLFAAMTLAEDDPRRGLAASMAKVAAGDGQRLLAKEAIQIHGGIGYTWEHDVHLLVKRIKAGDALFGTAAEHRARIAERLGL